MSAGGSGFPPKEELEKIVDRRLEEASAIWAPFGRRFMRASLDIAGPPRGLLLLRGRSAGVDAHGQSSRIGMRVDGVEASAPAAWKSGPPAIAKLLASSLESSFRVDLFERLIPSDREAVVLRVRRRDGGPVSLERIRDREDVSLSAEVLAPDLASGCEVGAERQISLDEAAILLGLRGASSDGIDLFLVPQLRAEGGNVVFSKSYRSENFAAPISGAALASWEIAGGSEKYPYGLAQALGVLLLPAGWNPRSEDSLFEPVLAERAAAGAPKRVGRLTGDRVREAERVPAAENVDRPKGIEQGGR